MNTSISYPIPKEKNYAPMVKESIYHFLSEYNKVGSNLSSFGSIFFRLIQAMPDPPLEIIWFYSAVTFHNSKPQNQDSSKEVLRAKDLLKMITLYSNSSSGSRKVATLVPVVYHLYHIVCEFPNLKREIEGLVDGVVSYISICCVNDGEEQELVVCFDDLVRVWTVDKNGDGLKLFLPLLSGDIRCVVKEDFGVGFLAGVVMVEAFLLKLSLKVSTDVQNDMVNLAVEIIKGFHNFHFLDLLLRMLLEPSLPVTTLLSSEDEVLLRKVLYDAILLGEYSFFNSAILTQLPGYDFKNLALLWLFVADNAIHFVRENGDHSKAISYIDAFSVSNVPNQLIKWITSQNGMEEKMSRPNISTPKALIKWLLGLANQGVRVFDQNDSKFHARAVICKSRVDYGFPSFKPNDKNPNKNTLFDNANDGRGEYKADKDQEMVDSLDHSFSTNGRRKRKGVTNEGVMMRIKLMKYNFDTNSVGEKFLPFSDDDDGLSSGSEVENPACDEDMVDMD